jgi:ABC-type amino acid transport substrate-binding protein
MLLRLFSKLLCVFLLGAAATGYAQQATLRVAVIEDSPPLSYIDTDGKLAGFNVALAEALCAEMKVKCTFGLTRLENLIDDVAAGAFDLGALGFLVTPERQKKVVFTQPVYRSTTLWLAKPGILPGEKKVRISTFRGSLQEKYIKAKGWDSISADTYTEFIEQFSAGVTNAMVAPLMTAVALQREPRFLALGIVATSLRVPELEGDACYVINPKRADLKEKLDKALIAVREQGGFARINTQYLPLRIN